MSDWHIITCEYPPQPGGVSDYAQLVAGGLAACGDKVHVWCPPCGEPTLVPTPLFPPLRRGDQGGGTEGVTVLRELGAFTSSDWRRADRILSRFPSPRRLLVQWVPHGYGYRSMNLGFCWWLRQRARMHGDLIYLMVHEPGLPVGEGTWKQNAVASIHRFMNRLLLSVAHQVWVTIPGWVKRWRSYRLGRKISFRWSPVPSTIPIVRDACAVSRLRVQYAPNGAPIIGHFGTYGRPARKLLNAALPLLLCDEPHCVALLLGRGSDAMRDELVARRPALADRIHATSALAATDISLHLQVCDIMLQPYPDGVTTRRTTTMAALAHRLPVVTTTGHLTEPLWRETGAVVLAPVNDIPILVNESKQLLASPFERQRVAASGRAVYERLFDVRHTIASLRSAA